MTTILKRFESFKNLRQKTYMEHFSDCCCEEFTHFTMKTSSATPMDTCANQSELPFNPCVYSDSPEQKLNSSFDVFETSTGSSSNGMQSPIIQTPKLRQQQWTPRKLKLKKRLQFIPKQCSVQKK